MNDSDPTPRIGGRDNAEQEFWRLWRQGNPPDVADFLTGKALGPEEAAAVLAVDQYERWSLGRRVPAEDYVRLLPDGPHRDLAECDLVYGEYLLREQLGERPDLAEYVARFPAHAEALARQVEVHQALADDIRSAVSAETGRSPSPTVREVPVPPSHLSLLPGPPGTALSLPPAAVAADAVPEIPGYEILSEIGRGGMGVVYKARQVSLDRPAALKVIRLPAGGDAVALTRLRREAQVTARLSHPNVVTVFDAGIAGEHFYLAMEYLDGIDLHRLVDRGGVLPVEAACEYVRQAALGLQHAHEHGLVHRDVKPSNLFVVGATESAPGRVKVLDLGLVRLPPTDTAEAGGPLTQDGSFMGTPDFIAPEQAADPRRADIRSDLYALGGTMFFLLTGRPPFVGPTQLSKVVAHHSQPAPPVETLRADVPAGVSAVLARLLAKNPADRYATPAELAAALPSPGAAAPPPASARVPVGPEPPSLRSGIVHRLAGHANWIKSVAFSPDGYRLASAGLDRTIRFWDVASGRPGGVVSLSDAGVLAVDFSPDGAAVVCGNEDHSVRVYDARTRALRWHGFGHADMVERATYSAAGDVIVTGGHDGRILVWEAATGRLRRQWSAHVGAVWGVALTADASIALTGGQDKRLVFWDVAKGEPLGPFPAQAGVVTCLALSPAGTQALTGGADGVVRLWDLAGRRELLRLEGHQGRVTGVEFSPDGRRALSAGRDLTARVWELAAGAGVAVLTGHDKWVTAAAWSPAGDAVATASVDRTVIIWRVPPA